MKKIISLLLAFLMIGAALASCSKNIKLPEPQNSKTVFTLGGRKIKYDYVRYVYLNTKSDMEYGEDEGFWENNPEAFEELKQATLDTILHNRAIEMLGERHKIKLTESEKKAVDDLLKELQSDDESWAEVEEAFFTEYSFVYLQRFSVLWGKTYDYVTSEGSGLIKSDDETVFENIPVSCRNIRYVYISYDETNKEAKKQLAEEVLSKANGGESFIELIKKHGEDTTMANYIDTGYYYTLGSITESVEKAVEELDFGGISPIIDTKDGFFIVQRAEIDYEYADKNIELFIDFYLASEFNRMVSEIKENMKTEFSDFWKNLKPDDIK